MLLTKTKIVTYSHGLIVYPGSQAARRALTAYCVDNLAEWEYVKQPPTWKAVRQIKRVFAGATRTRSEYRFHRNALEDVLRCLDRAGIVRSSILFEEKAAPVPVEVDLTMYTDKEALDYQVGLIEYLSRRDVKIKVTNLQTGKGKTFSALSAMSNIGVRTIIQLRGGYVNRWLDDLEAMFRFKKGELLVVRGSAALISIINQAKAGDFNAKVVVITNKTLHGLFKEHESNPEENMYGCSPEELYALLGVGLRIIDEVHEDYHFNFRADIYCNIESSIHLSATLETEDTFKRYLYDVALPPDNWYRGIEYDAYIKVIALQYNFKRPSTIEQVRLSERGSDMYSHGAYEKSIIAQPELLRNYLEIIRDPIQKYYIADWKAGEKCLVFCYLVEFVEMVTQYLQEFYHDLRVMSYVAGTDDIVLKKADIIVSTIGSCGTAIDIPGLKTSLLTQSVKKLEANEQIKGRLRKPRPPLDFVPTFLYLYNGSIPKHVEYHEAKVAQFRGKVSCHAMQNMPIHL